MFYGAIFNLFSSKVCNLFSVEISTDLVMHKNNTQLKKKKKHLVLKFITNKLKFMC